MTEPASNPEEELEIDEEALQRVPPRPAPPRPAPADEIVETVPIEDSAPPRPEPAKPAEVRDHAGGPVNAGFDFFAPPPPEIGSIVTQRSTLVEGKKPTPAGLRAAMSLGGGAALAMMGFILLRGALPTDELTGLAAGAGLLTVLIVFLVTRFTGMVSYVGKDGVARIWCAGDRDTITKREVFLFDDARELRTSQTRRYVNGVYTGTSYAFRWTARQGTVYTLSGTHRGGNQAPPAKDAFHFAASAEIAWSVHLLDRMDVELKKTGSIQFNLDRGNFVRVGPRFMEFGFGGQIARCDAPDIKGVSIDRGMFTVQRKDATIGWFSKTGVFSFAYGNMANAKLFIFALDKLMGMRFR